MVHYTAKVDRCLPVIVCFFSFVLRFFKLAAILLQVIDVRKIDGSISIVNKPVFPFGLFVSLTRSKHESIQLSIYLFRLHLTVRLSSSLHLPFSLSISLSPPFSQQINCHSSSVDWFIVTSMNEWSICDLQYSPIDGHCFSDPLSAERKDFEQLVSAN